MIVDISKHQGTIDFNKLKDKVGGVMLRCAYGTSQDIKFDDYVKGAKSESLPYGAYIFATWHYSTNSNPAKTAIEQANKAVEILNGKDVKGYVALDLELEAGKTTNLSKEGLTNIANTFMDIIRDAGYRPILYCSISWLYDHMISEQVKYPFWIAYYNDAGFNSSEFPSGKYGDMMRLIKDKIVLWQYSSKGKGADYGATSTYIDLNHLYGDFILPERKINPYAMPTVSITSKKIGQTLKAYQNIGLGVKWTQWELENKGYSVGRYGIDGVCGDDTVNAIKAFQRDNGLTPDGICGSKTRAKLVA